MKKQLHVISDGKLELSEFATIAEKIEPHVDKFHIREKQKTAKEIYEGVRCLLHQGIPINKIIINDRLDVAWALQVGVQLAFHSLPIDIVKKTFPNMKAGCSIHSIKEAMEMERRGADYLLYGHVFESNSKKGLPPRGINELQEIIENVKIPVLAIGGIKPENVGIVLKTGANGIAVMSGIIQADDPLKVVKHYSQQLNIGSGING